MTRLPPPFLHTYILLFGLLQLYVCGVWLYVHTTYVYAYVPHTDVFTASFCLGVHGCFNFITKTPGLYPGVRAI